MKEYIAFDSHKHYTLAEREEVRTGRYRHGRIDHKRGAIREYLSICPRETVVAVEATGNWYWIVDEIEQAGLSAALVHPRKAKLMLGMISKTDKLDVHGLNRLQRTGTLPTVWIPPGEVRDLRELTRTRMVLAGHRTRLKNRILATLSKYGFSSTGFSDSFGRSGRRVLTVQVKQLPPETRHVTEMLLDQLDFLMAQLGDLEHRLEERLEVTWEMKLLMSMPGVGKLLAAVILFEIGDVRRFVCAERLASYAGTTPRVYASGGKVRYGRLRPDVNHYLKWAFSEAGNSVAVNHLRQPQRYVSRRYQQIRRRRGHGVAVGAVARHLAESTFHILSKNEVYREPGRSELIKGRTREA
jgi:transposase